MSEDNKIKKKVIKKKIQVKEKIQEHQSIGRTSFETAQYINPPNSISVIRILLTGTIYSQIDYGIYFWAIINLLISYYTDGLDGWLARKLNLVTEFGAKLDPTADKILNIIVLNVSLNSGSIFTHELLGINNIYSITIIETILLLTAWIFKPLLISYGWKKKIGANWFGKWKMGLESASIILAVFYLASWWPAINQEIKFLAISH